MSIWKCEIPVWVVQLIVGSLALVIFWRAGGISAVAENWKGLLIATAIVFVYIALHR